MIRLRPDSEISSYMTLETILEHYGYIALFIGTVFESETTLIMGGILAIGIGIRPVRHIRRRSNKRSI